MNWITIPLQPYLKDQGLKWDFPGKNLVIERHGGHVGVPPESYGRAESVIAQQHYAELRYKTAESKAAYLIYLITKGHISPDGNKRTGILSGMVFLNINGFKIDTKHEDIEKFALWVADSDPHEKDLVYFIHSLLNNILRCEVHRFLVYEP